MLPRTAASGSCRFPKPLPGGVSPLPRRYHILPESVSRGLREQAGDGAALLHPTDLLLPHPCGWDRQPRAPQQWQTHPGEGSGVPACPGGGQPSSTPLP